MEHILKASYGEKRDPPVRRAAGGERLHARGVKEPEPPALPEKYRPPFWDSKKYGEPFGDFNKRMPKGAPAAAQRPASARGLSAAAAVAAAAAAARAASARRATEGAAGVGADGLAPGRVQQVEEAMRKCLQKKRALHKKVEEPLVEALAKEAPQGKVTVEGFVRAWARLGVRVTTPEATAMFSKYGRDQRGLMPCPVFVEGLLVGKSRLLAMGAVQRQGAFTDAKDAAFNGKIVYRPCRKGVYPPTQWDPALAARSSATPEHGLDLEFVYGYEGKENLAQNIFYANSAEVVYYAAAVGVVYNKETHTQRHFLEHDDDIKCITLHDDGRNIQTVATGQVGKYPTVLVWTVHDLKCQQRLRHPAVRGIIAVAFSPDGKRLVCCGSDDRHTLHVWDWRKKQLLAELPGQNGAPPQVYGVQWNPFVPSQFVSYGINHLKVWDPTNNGTYSHATWQFGKAGTHVVLSVAFLPSGVVVTGMPTGELALWKSGKCIRTVRAHAKGPQIVRTDGSLGHSGVRCLRLRADHKLMLSAGADGAVIAWDVTSGDIKEQSQILGTIALKSPYESTTPPMIRSLDCYKDSNVFIAGTARCDIWEVDETPEVLIYGHSADLYGLATNPVQHREFATCSDADRVYLWDTKKRHLLRTASLGGYKGRSLCFSPDARHLAVGMASGGISILDGATLQFLKWLKPFESAVPDLKYSPDGRYLAAASNDLFIDVFDVTQNYTKMARCKGHAATVSHLDWSVDGKVLMSNCNAYEVLYWEPTTGRQVKANQRDQRWASHSCVLGFPVMGIWPSGSDGTDVNALDRSTNEKYIVTVDDLGLVKMFNYPCVLRDPGVREYRGHCSHVMNVKWTGDDQRVITVGGKDRAVLQWRVAAQSVPADPKVVPPYPLEVFENTKAR